MLYIQIAPLEMENLDKEETLSFKETFSFHKIQSTFYVVEYRLQYRLFCICICILHEDGLNSFNLQSGEA